MKLIVGLGNPGDEYKNTRHNIGYMVIDNYLGNVNYKEKFDGQYYQKDVDGEKTIFLKPLTYMNNSGFCVKRFIDFFKINYNEIMVIQDDLDLDFGVIKYKTNSNSGGHNGIKSIIDCIGTNNFFRMKIGISKNDKNIVNYVLGNMSSLELKKIDFEKTKQAINDFIKYDCNYVMNKYNGNKND